MVVCVAFSAIAILLFSLPHNQFQSRRRRDTHSSLFCCNFCSYSKRVHFSHLKPTLTLWVQPALRKRFALLLVENFTSQTSLVVHQNDQNNVIIFYNGYPGHDPMQVDFFSYCVFIFYTFAFM